MSQYLSPGCKQARAQRRAANRRLCEQYGETSTVRATLRWLDDFKKRIEANRPAVKRVLDIHTEV